MWHFKIFEIRHKNVQKKKFFWHKDLYFIFFRQKDLYYFLKTHMPLCSIDSDRKIIVVNKKSGKNNEFWTIALNVKTWRHLLAK